MGPFKKSSRANALLERTVPGEQEREGRREERKEEERIQGGLLAKLAGTLGWLLGPVGCVWEDVRNHRISEPARSTEWAAGWGGGRGGRRQFICSQVSLISPPRGPLTSPHF